MSMTYLQLSSRLRQEVGGAGTGPTAVTSQIGEYRRFVDWIATADEDIQRMHNEWKFMRGSFTLNTVANTDSYAYSTTVVPITNFRDWRTTTLKIYRSSSGVGSEVELPYVDYQVWYDLKVGTQSASQPQCFTVGNAMEILLWPKPNDVYVISGEYQKSVTTMTANADVPLYPAEYHMLAVYKAMMDAGRYIGASEVYQDGKNKFKRMLKEMTRTQLPRIRMGLPLA